MYISAILYDKKGFFKFVSVPYPPPLTYLVPIPNSYNEHVWDSGEQILSSKERTNIINFDFDKIDNNCAVYKESI
jgi:hypothetical protein